MIEIVTNEFDTNIFILLFSGDSGGGLFVGDVDSYPNRVLVGIVSYGSSVGCEANVPAVFTRVTSLLNNFVFFLFIFDDFSFFRFYFLDWFENSNELKPKNLNFNENNFESSIKFLYKVF